MDGRRCGVECVRVCVCGQLGITWVLVWPFSFLREAARIIKELFHYWVLVYGRYGISLIYNEKWVMICRVFYLLYI